MNLSRAEVALLNLVGDEWTALDEAPAEGQAEAIEWRRRDELHRCLRCGQRAVAAFVIEFKPVPESPPRWLDLCAACEQWVRALAAES
jgi:hypothetical protein